MSQSDLAAAGFAVEISQPEGLKIVNLKTIVIAAMLCIGATQVIACDEVSGQTVTPSGVIVLNDGTEWEADDASTVSTWEGDDVLVCNEDKIINKSTGEQVDVTER
jgi:hypothetical protein